MHASILVASLIALVAAAVSTDDVPTPGPTPIWVSINSDGKPVTTATPRISTISGTTTLVDAPPYELTGTIFTLTIQAEATVSTGSRIPAPTGKKKNPAGAFARCFKKKGQGHAPFCDPAPGTGLYVGKTYYVTWDPDFFKPADNSTTPVKLSIQGNRLNSTGGIGKQIMSSKDPIRASYGYYAWKIKGSMLDHNQPTNVSLSLQVVSDDDDDDNPDPAATPEEHRGPTLLLSHKPPRQRRPHKLPDGAELYIALPIVFGMILVFVFGTLWWNRHARRIDIGNVMGRSRFSKARGRRMSRGRKDRGRRKEEEGILLHEFEADEQGR